MKKIIAKRFQVDVLSTYFPTPIIADDERIIACTVVETTIDKYQNNLVKADLILILEVQVDDPKKP